MDNEAYHRPISDRYFFHTRNFEEAEAKLANSPVLCLFGKKMDIRVTILLVFGADIYILCFILFEVMRLFFI